MAATPKQETEELKVFISNRDSTCGECGEDLGRKAWITLVKEKGALCLSCADLDHLIFLAMRRSPGARASIRFCPAWF